MIKLSNTLTIVLVIIILILFIINPIIFLNNKKQTEIIEDKDLIILNKDEYLHKDQKIKIAISLIILENLNLLKNMINSLINSDIKEFELVFFVWNNGNLNSESAKLIKKLNFETNIFGNNTNLKIVYPRIKLMEFIMLRDNEFLYILEIHDDMFFPKNWFKELIKVDTSNNIAILMPFIYNNYPIKLIIDEGKINRWNSMYNLIENQTLINPVQVHPWLIKSFIIKKLGYYDIKFHPSQVEDDDFYYRIISSGYKTIATKLSWVAHRGETTRKSEPLKEKLDLFYKKHNISLFDVKKKYNYNRPTWDYKTKKFYVNN